MPCFFALLGLFFPRVILALLYLFDRPYLTNAFQTVLWPLLGFLFMPFTTLAYAFAMNANGSISGIYLAILIVGVLLDAGALGSGHRARRRRVRESRD